MKVRDSRPLVAFVVLIGVPVLLFFLGRSGNEWVQFAAELGTSVYVALAIAATLYVGLMWHTPDRYPLPSDVVANNGTLADRLAASKQTTPAPPKRSLKETLKQFALFILALLATLLPQLFLGFREPTTAFLGSGLFFVVFLLRIWYEARRVPNVEARFWQCIRRLCDGDRTISPREFRSLTPEWRLALESSYCAACVAAGEPARALQTIDFRETAGTDAELVLGTWQVRLLVDTGQRDQALVRFEKLQERFGPFHRFRASEGRMRRELGLADADVVEQQFREDLLADRLPDTKGLLSPAERQAALDEQIERWNMPSLAAFWERSRQEYLDALDALDAAKKL